MFALASRQRLLQKSPQDVCRQFGTPLKMKRHVIKMFEIVIFQKVSERLPLLSQRRF